MRCVMALTVPSAARERPPLLASPDQVTERAIAERPPFAHRRQRLRVPMLAKEQGVSGSRASQSIRNGC
jgi:hypothetical protein